jgi:AcrR family transcriptional regulator
MVSNTMDQLTESDPGQRPPLSRERLFQAAIDLADRRGIEAVTMRNLAADLGVEAMSLYHHVANKQALLDGVVDGVVADIETELGGFDVVADAHSWRKVLRDRILTARRVMLRHPWAPAVIETRTITTPTTLRYMDTLLGILLQGGFSYDLAHHTMHAIGSRALGFSQELFQPNPDDDTGSNDTLAAMAIELPNIVGMLSTIVHDDPDTTLGWCDDQTEFEFGIDVLLDGLERRLGG